MIPLAAVVAAARSWIGTPFHHQARLKGVGVDCAGLIIGVARELGVVAPEFDVGGYSRVPDGLSMLRYVEEHMQPVAGEAQPGHVLLLRWHQAPQHLGVLGDYRHGGLSIIHAAERAGQVIETRLMFHAGMQPVGVFALPGTEGAWHSS